MKAVVLGSGAWGTALAMQLCRAGQQAVLWNRDPEKAARMRRRRTNPRLPGASLPRELEITADLDCLRGAELAVVAVPSYAVRETAAAIRDRLSPGTVLASAAKGVEPETCLRMTQVIAGELGEGYPLAALSGPSHAEEVAVGMPTGCVAAAEDPAAALMLQRAFTSPVFRVYTSRDVTGTELCGAVKNVVALGCGVAEGLGYGDNTRALLITRALPEAGLLVTRAGGSSSTCAGLAGVGDLIVTCTSRHSRNRKAGLLLGQGIAVQEALKAVGAVVEGYYAADSVRALAERLGVSMPICGCVYDLLYRDFPARECMSRLMGRELKSEF
jgi:glycerol-3-phosphate dehydrogenase (NAD(P)+)